MVNFKENFLMVSAFVMLAGCSSWETSAPETPAPETAPEETSEAVQGDVAREKYAFEIYRAEELGRALFDAARDDATVSQDDEATRAVEIASSANFKTCSHPFKAVAVAVEGDFLSAGSTSERETYVYQLSTPKEEQILSLGVHHRIAVAAGEEVPSELVSFTSNCLEVGTEPNTYAISMTHSRTPYPEEVHVWLSLTKKMDVYVVTKENNQNWLVKDGKIEWRATASKEIKALSNPPDTNKVEPDQDKKPVNPIF